MGWSMATTTKKERKKETDTKWSLLIQWSVRNSKYRMIGISLKLNLMLKINLNAINNSINVEL